MRKYVFISILLIMCLPLMAAQTYTLVLDPGHGGKDAGAVGRFSMEKDLNLSLALKVGQLIGEQYPDVKIIYTRDNDVFIPLQTRADIANKNNADLFMSIHTNSAENKSAHGVETFILGTEKMEKNLDVAMRENAVMKLEADYQTTYQGFDPNSIDSYIMFELMQNSYMDQSLQFATYVQNQFVGHLNRGDRGVRQAAFWVLLKTACPSILFEMGFISNPDEEKFINQESAMNSMAQALVDAFGAYTRRTRIEPPAQTEQPVQPAQPAQEQPTAQPVQTEQPVQPAQEQPATPAAQPVTCYAVQICASRTPLEPTDPKLQGQACGVLQAGEWYKYYVGTFATREEAQTKQTELKPLFPDCWVISFEK